MLNDRCVTSAEDRAKRTMESQFLEPPRETKIGLRNRGKKLQCSTE